MLYVILWFIKFQEGERDGSEYIISDIDEDLTLIKLLNLCSDSLKKDSEFLVKILLSYGRCIVLSIASEELTKNQNFFLEILQKNKYIEGSILEYASDDLKNDNEIVQKAVVNNPHNLEHASEDLRNDKEIVLAAVRKDGKVLEFASEDLQNDKEIVLAAVKKDGELWDFASEDLRNDQEIVLAAMEKDCEAYQYVGNKLKEEDEEFALKIALNAVSRSRWIYPNTWGRRSSRSSRINVMLKSVPARLIAKYQSNFDYAQYHPAPQ